MAPSTIHVLAGVNGSGKSSILGEYIRSKGGSYFNPDSYTKDLMKAAPKLSLGEAQSEAWHFGKNELTRACDTETAFAFETTLGGKTITDILLQAAKSGTRISVYYIGLKSVELNIKRVAERVERGGHDIPIEKIKKRWEDSRLNIIRLLPHLNELLIYDNSKSVSAGESPKPELLIKIIDQKIIGGSESLIRQDFPEWAQPIAMEAINRLGDSLDLD